MASVQVHPAVPGLSLGKRSKSKHRTVVKPILRKLHSHHSDRESSLDLDRGWDDQPSPGLATGFDFGGPYDSDGSCHYSSTAIAAARAGRDVGFSLSATDVAGGPGYGLGMVGAGAAAAAMAAAAAAAAAAGAGGRRKYSHVRSASGNSHASSVATTASAGRNGGSFVHPFQQTPQTSSPPLLQYANARASLDNGFGTGYSPTITEDDDDHDDQDDLVDPYASLHSTSTATTPRPALYPSAYFQHPNYRRPSLASQRTSSFSDGNQALRTPATRSSSAQARLLGTASLNQSRSELNSSTLSSVAAADSPLSSTAPLGTAATTTTTTTTTTSTSSFAQPIPASSSSSASLMSPLRSSLDMSGFRLRSHSEVDTATHQEQVREARRKFEAKERAKDEKYAREQLRKRERAETKEASRMEKCNARLRKGSVGNGSISGSTASGGADVRVASFRRRGAAPGDVREKLDFAGHGYDSTHAGQMASSRADEVHFASPSKRSRTAKHRTVGVWTAFVLWLRTRFLKLGRR